MGEPERLQKAVELTISAGYQLNKDAFEFLTMVSSTEDPAIIVTKAIKQMNSLEDRPLFLEKQFLEEMLRPLEPAKEIVTPQAESRLNHPSQSPQISEMKKPFHPYAKEIEADLKIIDDPGSKIDTGGTIDDYLEYFQDRFRKLEKLLRQRMDVKSATSLMEKDQREPDPKKNRRETQIDVEIPRTSPIKW